MMNPRQRQLIVETFALLHPEESRAGVRFYGILFSQTPGLIPMFGHVSIPEQGGKLIQVLAYLVEGIALWDETTSQLEQLGAQHVGFGVRSDHYAAVGTALITTLQDILGSSFTEEAEEAWEEFYTEVSLVMERGARRATAENEIDFSKGTI